jgi:hypothetical protein
VKSIKAKIDTFGEKVNFSLTSSFCHWEARLQAAKASTPFCLFPGA